MHSKKKERNWKDSVWTLVHASVRWLRHFSQVREKRKKEKKRKKKKGLLRDISVWCFPVDSTFCYIVKRKEKGKRTVSEISSLLVWSSPINILLCCVVFQIHPCVEIFWLCYYLNQFVFFCTYLFQRRITFINSR